MRPAVPDRRGRLTAAALAALLLVVGPALAAQGEDEERDHEHPPAVEGQDATTTAADNDPRVRAIGKQLTCYCGCNTQSIADCTCGVAQKERRAILAQLSEGETPETIIAGWVDRYGPRILLEPPREGFNLLGWFLPGILLSIAALFLILHVRRSSGDRLIATVPPKAPAAADSAYREQIRRELERRQR